MLIREALQLECNVRIEARARGKLVAVREGHNVFVNQGRQWLRDHMAAALYPPALFEDANLTGDNGQAGNADNFSPLGKTYKPRFIGLGVGGALQSITPPGPGGFTEVATINRLEYPVLSTTGQYLKEVLPQPNTADMDFFPTDYSVRYRGIFEYNDVSFAGQVDGFGTAVPISEAALFTSRAGRDLDPAVGVNGTLGCIAYHIFEPLTKTPEFVFEVAWELRS